MLRLIVGAALGLGAYVGALQAQSCPPPLTLTTIGWVQQTGAPITGTVTATTTALPPCYLGWKTSAPVTTGALQIKVPNGPVKLTLTFTPTGATQPVQIIVIQLNWPSPPVRLTPDAPGPIVIT